MTRPDRAGFTLLEVMGAVAILGLVATSLMTASINSTRISGDARDRLTASLLADSVIAEIESAAARGNTIPAGEREIDGFIVTVAVTPLDPAAIGLEPLVDRERGAPFAAALVASPRGPSPLSLIRVEVTSTSGVAVSRVSFAFDPFASDALAQLAGTEEGEALQ